MSMMTGDSAKMATAKATPKAARFSVGPGRRAMTAARKGPSTAIMNQVPARGSQKARILL